MLYERRREFIIMAVQRRWNTSVNTDGMGYYEKKNSRVRHSCYYHRRRGDTGICGAHTVYLPMGFFMIAVC